LAGQFVPIGLTLLGPAIVNILLFHILPDPTGLPMAIVVAVLALIVLWHYRASSAGLVKPGLIVNRTGGGKIFFAFLRLCVEISSGHMLEAL
jgi:hypothetical protein